jgi:hypothetical protein
MLERGELALGLWPPSVSKGPSRDRNHRDPSWIRSKNPTSGGIGRKQQHQQDQIAKPPSGRGSFTDSIPPDGYFGWDIQT